MDQYNQSYNPSFESNTLVTYDFMGPFADGDDLSYLGQQDIGYYDDVLGNQMLNNIYATISCQSRSESISSSPPPSTCSERRLSMGHISISHALNKQDRRRYQNRVSQRAFRERKAKERATLDDQLKQLADKHQRLLESYSSQSVEVGRLKAEIQDLTRTIDALSSKEDGLNGSIDGTWTDETYPLNAHEAAVCFGAENFPTR